MSHFEILPDDALPDAPPVSAAPDDDVPARRLLAHDMEHLIWDDDDGTMPPPD